MRKELTPEQKAKSAARREQFRGICQRLAAMTEEQRAELASRMAGLCNVEGHVLSQHNACLIWSQNPQATIVGGFHQWRKQGRMVRKGEHGMMIWCRTSGKNDEQPTATESADLMPSQEGEPARKSRQFIIGTVFDISQTDEAKSPAVEAGELAEVSA